MELGKTIALVAESDAELATVEDESAPPPGDRSARPNATRKAVELAAAHGIDLASIEREGFITAEDVEALVARTHASDERFPAEDPRLAGVSTEGVTLPDCFALEEGVGRLDERFLRSLRADPEALRELSSEERCEAYRRGGARIGENVRLGERTLIDAPQIVIEDGVAIGDDGLVRCEELFAVGSLTHVGPRFEVTCRRAYIGANGHFGRGVRIGGGGARDPWGTFAIGDLAFVGDETFINPCRPVIVGREVFLTMRSIILTHNIGHSVLEGFENRFAPVVLEDRAQVGIGSVIYAGCRIGREAIIASSSYVVSDIAPGKLAVGVPARAAGSSSHPLSRERQSRLLRRMVDELHELLVLRGVQVSPSDVGPTRGIEVRTDGGRSLILALDELTGDFQPPKTDAETVILTLALKGEAPPGCVVLDLIGRRVHGTGGGPVLEAVREFCRKRGIRLEPGPWRYSGGPI